MRQLAEFIPIVLFFVVYKMDGDTVTLGAYSHTVDGIFTATAVLIAATVIQVLLTLLLTRELDKRSLWMMVAVIGFGGATLLFRNEAFIQWKPTIFNWVLAIAFAGSQFIGKKNLIERTLGSQLELPRKVWRRLNVVWSSYFAIVGALNLVVAYRYSEATWVSYKLYSAIGFTVFLTAVTAIIIAPHLKDAIEAEEQENA